MFSGWLCETFMTFCLSCWSQKRSTHVVGRCHMTYCFNTVHVKVMDILLVRFGEDIIGTPDTEILIFFFHTAIQQVTWHKSLLTPKLQTLVNQGCSLVYCRGVTVDIYAQHGFSFSLIKNSPTCSFLFNCVWKWSAGGFVREDGKCCQFVWKRAQRLIYGHSFGK